MKDTKMAEAFRNFERSAHPKHARDKEKYK